MDYQLIYVDPPWQHRKGNIRKVRPLQKRSLDYPVIPLNEIKSQVQSVTQSEQQVLFLWTIDKYLFQAEQLAQSLGFKLHARLIWNKLNGVAPAFTVRFSHEYLLWMYKGKMLPIAANTRGVFPTVFEERSTKHSKKPTAAYELMECLYPDLLKIELYARSKREGWDVWGNQVESDIEIAA